MLLLRLETIRLQNCVGDCIALDPKLSTGSLSDLSPAIELENQLVYNYYLTATPNHDLQYA